VKGNVKKKKKKITERINLKDLKYNAQNIEIKKIITEKWVALHVHGE